jgi:hypothetical protein
MIVSAGANTNVFAYNYSREVRWNENSMAPDICVHGNFPFANLFEHNVVMHIEADKNFIPHGPYHTFVRNRCTGLDNFELRFIKDAAVLGCEVYYGIEKQEATCSIDKYAKALGQPGAYDEWFFASHRWFYEAVGNPVIKPFAALKDTSYFYSKRPYFLDSSYTFPTIGPPSAYLSQTIPAEQRYYQRYHKRPSCFLYRW